MKTLFITLLLLVSGLNTPVIQDSEKVNATFEGLENGIYFFTDTDGFSIEFEHISQEALDSIDLSDDTYKGKMFTVTYVSETEIDEMDEEIVVNTIIALNMVQ